MRVASLFSGAGGLDLGLEQVLRKHFPGVRLCHDVCDLASLPKDTELVAAGFPCIDVSRAGLRAGMAGRSSSLVKHVFRLLDQASRDRRPVPWVLLENVQALLDRTGSEPPVVKYIVEELERLGYQSWAHRILNSAAFGVPNRRKRVFLVASMHGDARDVLLSRGKEACKGGCTQLYGRECFRCHIPDLNSRCSFALDMGNARSAAGVDMVPTFTTSNERICLLMADGKMGSLRIEDAERLQGLPEGHTEACYPIQRPGVDAHRERPLRDSDSDKREAERWTLIGNAVTVPVARWIGQRLMHPYKYKYIAGVHDRRSLLRAFASEPLPEGQKAEPGSEDDEDVCLSDMSAAEMLIEGPRDAEEEGDAGAEGQDGAADLAGAAAVPNPICSPLVSAESPEPPATPDTASAAAPGQAAPAAASTVAGAAGDAEAAAPEAGLEAQQAGTPQSSVAGTDVSPSEAAAAPNQAAEAAAPGHATQPEAAGGEAAAAQSDGAEHRKSAVSAPAVQSQAAAVDVDSDAEVELQPVGRSRSGRRNKPRSEGWPKAAWYLKGLGRFGVRHMSDAPELRPFTPLGAFIAKLGRPPAKAAMHTYLMRLREQGWDVSETVRKAVACGAKLDKELTKVVRLQGTDNEAASLGELVWAKGDGDCWWPGEMLDPWDMPPGRQLPEGALAVLSNKEVLASIPDVASRQGAEEARRRKRHVGRTKRRGQLIKLGEEAAGAAGEQEAGEDEEHIKVLVIYLGDRSWAWFPAGELLPYEDNRREKVATGEAALAAKSMTRPTVWRKALQEARDMLSLRSHAQDSKAYAKAVAAKAARGAAQANMRKRCHRCEACMSKSGVQRRCLTNRVAAAAAAGHSGAQVAILREAAIGATLRIWWPLDEEWYTGKVRGFDWLRQRHEVLYEDGDVEIIPLWAPNQMIHVMTDPKTWPEEAERLGTDQNPASSPYTAHSSQQERARQKKAAVEPASEEPAPEPLEEASEGEEAVPDLERQRRANIARNKQRMAQLGLQDAAAAMSALGRGCRGVAAKVAARVEQEKAAMPAWFAEAAAAAAGGTEPAGDDAEQAADGAAAEPQHEENEADAAATATGDGAVHVPRGLRTKRTTPGGSSPQLHRAALMDAQALKYASAPPLFRRDPQKEEMCIECNKPGWQPEMQPCVACLHVNRAGSAIWCHNLCLSLAMRRRAEKCGLVDWKCMGCAKLYTVTVADNPMRRKRARAAAAAPALAAPAAVAAMPLGAPPPPPHHPLLWPLAQPPASPVAMVPRGMPPPLGPLPRGLLPRGLLPPFMPMPLVPTGPAPPEDATQEQRPCKILRGPLRLGTLF